MANSILDVKELLNEYSLEVQEAITHESESVAKEGASKLKQTSPKRTGAYAKGWRSKTEKGNGYVSSIIYNATNWQLTHLLEKPHLLRNGKVSNPKVHIAPIEQECIKRYETSVEEIIKKGF